MKQSLLFTGHMIDAPGRAEPRFPPEKENMVRKAIWSALQKEKETATGNLTGIASGDCGASILFLECCIELGIPAEIYLPLPIHEFRKTSVAFAGEDWNRRFDDLCEKLPLRMLPHGTGDQSRSVWERANEWMLSIAMKNGRRNMSLLALWNGKKGDGAGGTEEMVRLAEQQQVRIEIIDINKLEGI